MTDPNIPQPDGPQPAPHDVHAGGNPDPAASDLTAAAAVPGSALPTPPPAPAPAPAPQPQPHLAVAAGDELPPLVTVTENGEIAVDFQGALEHVPDCVLTQAQRVHPSEGAVVQLQQRVGQLLAERAATDLARDILALTNPEPEIIETAGGGETIATPPGAVE